ncbi:hypothetical protein D3C75_461230 [compost metagenome]
MNRFAKGAENNALFGEFFTVSGRHRNGVKNGIHGDIRAFMHRDTKLFKSLFYFARQIRIAAGLLNRTRLRLAVIVTTAARRRRVIAVILIVQLFVVGFQPVWLFHFKPGTISIQAKFQHPLGLITPRRDRPHHIFVDAVRHFVGFQLGEKAFFIRMAARPGLHFFRRFSVT